MARFNIRGSLSSLAQFVRTYPVGVCALLIALLYWPALGSGYLMDDYIHQQAFGLDPANTPRDHLGIITLFDFSSGDANPGLPWWASQGIETRFWRPLSSVLGYVDHLIAPHQPVWAHIHSILWFIASIASLRFLLRETCDQGKSPISWVALLTLLIYSMTCTHAFATLWIANRNALIASSLAWASIALYAKGQRKGSRLTDLGSAFLLGAALLAGEIAWVGVIQLGCFATWGDDRSWPKKLRSLWPHALVIFTWTLTYLQQGYGAHGGGYYLHPIADFWLFLQDAPLRLAQLGALALAFLPIEISQSDELKHAVAILGAMLIGLALWCARRVLPECSPNHRRSLRWMGLAGVLGTLPILGAQPNDRLLVPIMLSTSFFFATMIRYLGQRRKNRIFLGLAGLGVLRHLVLAPMLTLVVTWSLTHKSQAGNAANARFASSFVAAQSDELHFLLNSTGPAHAWSFDEHIAYLRGEQGPSPRWRFAAATRSDLDLVRSSATSFELATSDGSSLASGLFGKLLRSQLDQHRDPLSVGAVIDRQDFSVQVLTLDPTGMPTRVRFEFPSSTALDRTRFFHWDGQSLQEISLPEMGKTKRYPWKIGPMKI